MKEKKKSCVFKFLIPVISLILFVLIRRNVKGNGAKAERTRSRSPGVRCCFTILW